MISLPAVPKQMDMRALARCCAVRPPPKPPYGPWNKRIEPRLFYNGEGTEVRSVDVLSKDAAIPLGTTITCEGGHEICTMAESLDFGQRSSTRMLGRFAPFQGLLHDHGEGMKPTPPCLCGRLWARGGRTAHGVYWGQLHTAEGWRPSDADRMGKETRS